MSSREAEDRALPPRERGAAGAAEPGAAAAPAPPVSVSSRALFGTADEVQITHRGAVYRLKQTALGKLILTK